MNLSKNAASAALAAILTQHNGGSAKAYSGAMPATPETALSGNTALVAATYQSPAFGSQSFSGGFQQASANFTAANYAPSNSGGATFIRVLESDGTTVIEDCTVGAVWQASIVTAVGQYCTNGGNTYISTAAGTTAASGGPTGTGTGITDGTVTWNYVGAGQLFDFLL